MFYIILEKSATNLRVTHEPLVGRDSQFDELCLKGQWQLDIALALRPSKSEFSPRNLFTRMCAFLSIVKINSAFLPNNYLADLSYRDAMCFLGGSDRNNKYYADEFRSSERSNYK
jgi:hypothetical protein